MWPRFTKKYIFIPLKKNPYGIFLKSEPKEQHLNAVVKPRAEVYTNICTTISNVGLRLV